MFSNAYFFRVVKSRDCVVKSEVIFELWSADSFNFDKSQNLYSYEGLIIQNSVEIGQKVIYKFNPLPHNPEF